MAGDVSIAGAINGPDLEGGRRQPGRCTPSEWCRPEVATVQLASKVHTLGAGEAKPASALALGIGWLSRDGGIRRYRVNGPIDPPPELFCIAGAINGPHLEGVSSQPGRCTPSEWCRHRNCSLSNWHSRSKQLSVLVKLKLASALALGSAG